MVKVVNIRVSCGNGRHCIMYSRATLFLALCIVKTMASNGPRYVVGCRRMVNY